VSEVKNSSIFRRRLLAVLPLILVGVVTAEQGAKYLIIAADNYVGAVQPLADWKTRKGMLATIVPISQIGANPASIQTYIRTAYNTWPVRPEYVLLAGDPSLIPAYGGNNDCYYGDMGGSQLMEISVGRFPATTAYECSVMVAKTLSYERPSWTGDTMWYVKGTTIVNDDNPPDPYYEADSRLVRGFWQDQGYAIAESLSDTRGHSSSNVNAAAADGRTFITYRGQCVGNWWPPFNAVNPAQWNNGAKLPIIVTGSCATVTLNPGETMQGDAWVRYGTLGNLGGAVAYYGTTFVGSHVSAQRSAGFRGFFTALYSEKLYRIGPATIRGRFWVDSLFPGQSQYYYEWTLMGDPELNVWTGMPRKLDVQYDSVIPMAPQTFNVTATSGGVPASGALVCVWMDSVVYASGVASGSGQIGFPINPTHVGAMSVTVTGSNLRPFEGEARVMVTNAPYLVVETASVDDYIGNHDHVVNPGERFRLTAGLRNLGGATAAGVTAVFRTSTPGVVIYDSTSSYGVIMPDSTAFGDPFDLSVDSGFADGQPVFATLEVRDNQGDTWDCPVSITVRAGRLTYRSAALADLPPGGNGNGRLGRGESGRIRLAIQNAGGGPLAGIAAVVHCLDTNVVVTDSTAYYGEAAAGETLSGTRDQFGVTAGPGLIRNQPVAFSVRLWSDGGTYRRTDTFSFEIPAEQGLPTDPTGPDAYGYWCYDNTDTASGRAPTYDWVELASPGPGELIPVVSDSDAATRTLPIPFSFRYYGASDNFMSACSNGFLALGYTNYNRGANRGIPDTAGPPLMIAPFWDDLNPDENDSGYGTAYQWYDTTGHRWIVEYKDFAHYHQPNIRETFEAIFYDPAYHPTPSGDGEIVFQYNRVSLNSGCTIGIEDNTETRGIQYVYNNTYAQTAAYLQAGRALKFTTYPPANGPQPWLLLVSARVSDSLYGNNNGMFEPGETLTVAATVRNSGSAPAVSVAAVLRDVAGEGAMIDSSTPLPDIPVGGQAANSNDPFVYRVALLPADSIVEMGLVLTANDYSTICYFAFGLVSMQAVGSPGDASALRTALEWVRPNPVTRTGLVCYGLARAARVDLALYDAAGRRRRTLFRGEQARGRYEAGAAMQGLSQGVYFCRLTVSDADGVHRFMRKVEVVR